VREGVCVCVSDVEGVPERLVDGVAVTVVVLVLVRVAELVLVEVEVLELVRVAELVPVEPVLPWRTRSSSERQTLFQW